jgi:hypothetical protein
LYTKYPPVLLGALHSLAEPSQTLLDALAEAHVHGLVFLLAVRRADRYEGLFSLGTRTQSGFHAIANLIPIPFLDELRRPFLQLRFGRPSQVATLGLVEPRHVVFAAHPVVHDPNPVRLAVPVRHRRDYLLHRRDIGTVAGEHFVTQWHSILRHHQGDAYLFAIRSLIATVPTLCLPPFVRQQLIECAVKPVVVDGVDRNAEQIIQSGSPVPILGNLQLTRRLAQTRNAHARTP